MASFATFVLILLAFGRQVNANDVEESDNNSTCAQKTGSTGPKRSATVSATLRVSAGDVDARQDTSFTVNSNSASSGVPVNATESCSTNTITCGEPLAILRSMQETLEAIKGALEPDQLRPADVTNAHVEYPLLRQSEKRWRLFWWYRAGTTWPENVTDVLQDKYGDCDPTAAYCFSRFPEALQETAAEMLATDTAGNMYRWTFDPDIRTAHALWRAFHDQEEVRVVNGGTWNPITIKGDSPGRPQDSFQYRMEHGVRSLLLDDDSCDCYSSLSLGHGMCNTGFSTDYGPENVYGADLLYDSYCQTPTPNNGVYLYFRDEDDCTNVECPTGFECVDGVSSYSCRRK